MKNYQLMSAIEVLRYRYRYFGKKKKGEVLRELCERFSVDRKYLIRLFAPKVSGRPKKSKRLGRPSKYSDAIFQAALYKVWKITKFMCGRYLREAMPVWLPSIEEIYGAFDAATKGKLLTISASTIDRHLRDARRQHGKTFTRRGSVVRSEVPILGNIWDTTMPGFIECDTVAHCGVSMLGDFVNTVTTVDIATTWAEVRGTWGRGSSGVIDQLKDIEASLPFDIKGYDADNGGEVLNKHVINYFHNREIPVAVTRSRAYKKDDNCHVEQKNNSIARKYLGYERLDCQEALPLINHYYKKILCPLLNHFYPSNKLKDKRLVAAKMKRFYDKPKTPYQRVLESPHVSKERKQTITFIHYKLNPVLLRIEEENVRKLIDDKMKTYRAHQQNKISKIQGFDLNKSSKVTNPFSKT
jgi:hypothetical protein